MKIDDLYQDVKASGDDVRFASPPPKYNGTLPELVLYENSIPVSRTRGTRNVVKALSRMSRDGKDF